MRRARRRFCFRRNDREVLGLAAAGVGARVFVLLIGLVETIPGSIISIRGRVRNYAERRALSKLRPAARRGNKAP